MPRTFPSAAGAGIDVFAMLQSGVSTIGGDFYDFMLADGKFYFCIGTVL